ncbi:PREDICTED: solute carrier family 35 member C2-like isoform X1 [Branchiostoma belcheri]|uniref:Solute carrier family 35 member C2-like isoform X1 n=1 Tax=Branchiostoma belcheri TaxID=7741 RepID=A0A6P4ZIP5_BRABE|nr:PREDICTED: solute carrier family 35 member C2-like isoform X1 [Branchiostoma belcheri]
MGKGTRTTVTRPGVSRHSSLREVLVECAKTFGLVLFYYCFSISITFYNKAVLKGFHYPLSMTMCHFATNFVTAGVVRKVMQVYTGEKRVTLSWKQYIHRVGLTGLASSMDIGLSNWSFLYITVSLYTMSKSTCIIFILGFAILFKLEKPRCSLVIVILLIAAGLFMFTYKSTHFNLEGFILVMTASVLGGLRWTLTQILTQKQEIGLHNPIDVIYHLTPVMMVGLFPLMVYNEGLPISLEEQLFRYHSLHIVMLTVGKIMLGATLAFMLGMSEFLLLHHTSSLTLSVSGIFKEIWTLLIDHFLNGTEMAPVNIIGCIICIAGITLHVVLKATHSKENTKPSEETRQNPNSLEMLIINGDANPGSDEEEEEEVIYAHR